MPIKGRANKEIIKFLATILKIPKGNIGIKKGNTNSKKLI